MNTELPNVVSFSDRRPKPNSMCSITSAIALHPLLAGEFASRLLNFEPLHEGANDDILTLANELADLALPVRKP